MNDNLLTMRQSLLSFHSADESSVETHSPCFVSRESKLLTLPVDIVRQRYVFFQKGFETSEQRKQKRQEFCLNMAVLNLRGNRQWTMMLLTAFDIIVRYALLISFLNFSQETFQKWVFVYIQGALRCLMIVIMLGISFDIFRKNEVSQILKTQCSLQGKKRIWVLVPPELYIFKQDNQRITNFIAINSIFRGLETVFLFGTLLYLVVQKMTIYGNNQQHLTITLCTIGEETIRYLMTLSWLSSQVKQA